MKVCDDAFMHSPVSTYPSLNINQSTQEKATTKTWLLEDKWDYVYITMVVRYMRSIRIWGIVYLQTSKLRRAKNFFLSILLDICSVLSIWIPKNKALKKFKISPTFENNKSGSNNQCHILFEHTNKAIHKYIQIFEIMICIRFED